jgi:sporulation protein YlmC with PRC-barrel domain
MNGMKIITADAYTVGEVGGAHADTSTWQITHLEIELNKEAANEFGFKKPVLGAVSVCLPIAAVNKIGDVITLNQSFAELKNIKECSAE